MRHNVTAKRSALASVVMAEDDPEEALLLPSSREPNSPAVPHAKPAPNFANQRHVLRESRGRLGLPPSVAELLYQEAVILWKWLVVLPERMKRMQWIGL